MDANEHIQAAEYLLRAADNVESMEEPPRTELLLEAIAHALLAVAASMPSGS